MSDLTESCARLGPVRLAPGVSLLNGWAFLYAAFAGISLSTFISVIQPYVLNVNLAVPATEQGRLSGDLVFYGEIVLLLFSGLAGALSDRVGRRIVIILGLLIFVLGYSAYGFANNVWALTAVRVFLAFGIAAVAVMVAAIQVDYPAEESRGRLVGFSGVAIGLGAVLLGVLFSRLPFWFVSGGATELDAGRYALLTMAGFSLVTAMILRLGLKGGRPPHTQGRTPLRELLVRGISAGRENPRVMLSYACAFVGRADMVTIGTFYTLWLTQAGLSRGMSADEAARTAGAFFGLVMGVALLWAPIMGAINDRMDRTLAMALSLALATFGYLAMGVLPDPLGPWMYPAAVMLGIGQMSVVSASQTLVGQESPPELRGSVIGVFSLFGAGGILFVTGVGGRLFDALAPSAPFVMVGLVNAMLCVVAFRLGLRRKTGSDRNLS